MDLRWLHCSKIQQAIVCPVQQYLTTINLIAILPFSRLFWASNGTLIDEVIVVPLIVRTIATPISWQIIIPCQKVPEYDENRKTDEYTDTYGLNVPLPLSFAEIVQYQDRNQKSRYRSTEVTGVICLFRYEKMKMERLTKIGIIF